MSFTAWVAAQGVKLSPAQHILASVAIDGCEPQDYRPDFPAEVDALFGASVETIPPDARAVLVAVLGARSGKDYVFAALYAAWRALTADVSMLAPAEQATISITAPDLRLARHTVQFVRGLRIMQRDVEGGAVEIARPDGRTVLVEPLPAAARGTATRGRSLLAAVLTESAFFRDADGYTVNDEDVFKSVRPRVMPGGLTLLVSTPWTREGLTWELFKQNRGQPRNAIAAHGSTELLRADNDHILSMVRAERSRDPENAEREFDAEFLSADARAYFDPVLVDGALTRAPEKPQSFTAGWDGAHLRDAASLVIVSWPGPCLVERLEWQPAPDAPLRYREIIPAVAALCQRYQIRTIWADHFEIEAAKEWLPAGSGVELVPIVGGREGKNGTHAQAREMLATASLNGDELLASQLKSVIVEAQSGGQIRLSTPRRGGRHGDIASAWICAVGGEGFKQQQYREGLQGLIGFFAQGRDPHARLRGPWPLS